MGLCREKNAVGIKKYEKLVGILNLMLNKEV